MIDLSNFLNTCTLIKKNHIGTKIELMIKYKYFKCYHL